MLRLFRILFVAIGAVFTFYLKGGPKKSWRLKDFVFVKIIQRFLRFPDTTDTKVLYAHIKSVRADIERSTISPKDLSKNFGPLSFSELAIPRCDQALAAIYPDFPLERISKEAIYAEALHAGDPNHTVETLDNSSRVVLTFHGGAYTLMSPRTHRVMALTLSKYTNCFAIAVDYRLAPEDPFPAGLFDAVSSVIWAIKTLGLNAGQIVIQGDSAGGGLAFALLLFIRDHQRALEDTFGLEQGALTGFAGYIGFSPWLDLTMTAPSILLNRHCDYLIDPENMNNINGGWVYAYGFGIMPRIEAKDPTLTAELHPVLTSNPYLSPVYARSFEGLPPIFINAGSAELLLSDALGLFGRLTHKVEQSEYETSQWLRDMTVQIIEWDEANSGESAEGQFGADFQPQTREKLIIPTTGNQKIRVETYHDQVHVFVAFPHFKFRKDAYKSIANWVSSISWPTSLPAEIPGDKSGLFFVY